MALPMPKPPQKPITTPKPGLLGGKGYHSFVQLRESARKDPYKSIPTYSRKFTGKEKVDLINTLQKYSGQSYGLSNEKLAMALGKMKKEKMLAGYKRDYKKIKELDQNIKQLEAWKKG